MIFCLVFIFLIFFLSKMKGTYLKLNFLSIMLMYHKKYSTVVPLYKVPLTKGHPLVRPDFRCIMVANWSSSREVTLIRP